MLRILIADDQYDVRSALRLLLEHEGGMRVIGEVAEIRGLIELAPLICPDLVLLDWELPGSGGSTISLLRSHCPQLQVIVLSGRPEMREQALRAGADAFVCKGDSPEKLVTSLRAMMAVYESS